MEPMHERGALKAVPVRRGAWAGEIDAGYAESDLVRLFDGPQFPAPGFPGVVEEFHRNVGVTYRVRQEGAEGERTWFAKSFGPGSWRDFLSSPFTETGAARSWRAARIMSEVGLPTPRPVAFLERKSFGVRTRSVYISEAAPGAQGRNLEIHFRENFDLPSLSRRQIHEKREIIRRLAAIFRAAHGQDRIYFPDFHPHNMLMNKRGDFEIRVLLVDFDEVHFRVRKDDRIKNLASLCRNADKVLRKMTHRPLTTADRVRFLREYLGPESDSAQLQKLWSRIIANWDLK